jgi:Iron-containing redox enzyme
MDAAAALRSINDPGFRQPLLMDDVWRDIESHPAMRVLNDFNRHLAARVLTLPERLLFLASVAAFNRHTVAGIAILAGRISDEILPLQPRTGHRVGASVLDAAVDEYGLHGGPTHVELARDFANYLGVDPKEVEATANAAPTALKIGESLRAWYREAPVAFSLGVHLASEATSVTEFMAWHEIFLNFPQYRFTRDTPEFEYLRAHFALEPDHIRSARGCCAEYLQALPGNGRLLQDGADRYLDLYRKMFHELDTLIFK